MRKINFLFIVLSFILLPALSFAYSREDVMNEALEEMESVSSSKDIPKEQAAVTLSKKNSSLIPNKIPSHAEEKISHGKERDSKNIFYVSAGYDFNHIRYKELSGGNVLDEDRGDLQGFYAYAKYKYGRYIAALQAKPFIEGYYRRYGDSTTYKGASSAGQLLTFKEHAQVERFGLKLGAYADFSKKGEISGYFDAGRRLWQRGENRIVEGVIAYAEKYYWTYFGFGIGIDYEFLPELVCGIDIEGMFAPNSLSRMRADLYEGGTFNIKRVSGFEIKLPLKYYFLKNISFDFAPYFTYWQIAKSDLVKISGAYYYEPDSKTKILGLLTGFTYSF